jgi:hypothetical protein
LPEVPAIAIDAALSGVEPANQPAKSQLYAALVSIGFIGCIDDDPSLSTSPKAHPDFVAKMWSIAAARVSR